MSKLKCWECKNFISNDVKHFYEKGDYWIICPNCKFKNTLITHTKPDGSVTFIIAAAQKNV